MATLSLQQRLWLPFRRGRIDADIHNLGIRYVYCFLTSLDFDSDFDCDRSPADFYEATKAANDVAHKHGILEFDPIECHRYEYGRIAAGLIHKVLRAGVGGHI